MGQTYLMPPDDVNLFLNTARSKLDSDDDWQINDQEWAGGKINKTRTYMAETGITSQDIKQVIKELSVANYSSTQDDTNIHFPGEKVWIFGITKNLIDHDEDLYIKLKLRKIDDEYLLIMSFHPEQPTIPEDKLEFPYLNYNIKQHK